MLTRLYKDGSKNIRDYHYFAVFYLFLFYVYSLHLEMKVMFVFLKMKMIAHSIVFVFFKWYCLLHSVVQSCYSIHINKIFIVSLIFINACISIIKYYYCHFRRWCSCSTNKFTFSRNYF